MKYVLWAVAVVLPGLFALAECIPADVRFIQDGERRVRGWTFNDPEDFKPYGDVRSVMLDGRAGVRLTSKGRQTQLYQDVTLDVKPGERYRVSARVRGRGTSVSLGFFKSGPEYEWRGETNTFASSLAVQNAEPELLSHVYVVEENVARIRVHLCARDGAEAEFYDVVVEKILVENCSKGKTR